MTTPDFILKLRAGIGHDPLWLMGVTAVLEHEGRVLLVRRADDSTWTPVTGIIDPDEEPAWAARRELLEETGVVGEPVRLTGVRMEPRVTYANGDVSRYIGVVFLFRWVSGEPWPADGENSEVRWFPRDALPQMPPHHRENVEVALSGREAADFVR